MTKFGQLGIKGFDKYKNYRRLGIFDSGVGGLSILKYLQHYADDKQLISTQEKNNKEIIYIADTGRFPYGTKSPAQITTYTEQIIHYLERKNVDLVIFGCNTASAIAGNKMIGMTKLPVLDLIDPVARHVSQLGLGVGILATEATVKSGAFSSAIKNYAPHLNVKEIASPDLVNIVENGDIKNVKTKLLLANYVEEFTSAGAEIIVLGCTHFSFLKETILALVDKHIQILDPAELIVQMFTATESNEDDHSITKPKFLKDSLEPTFFVTGDVEAFSQTAAKCLGYPLKSVNQLCLEELESLKA